MSQRRARRERRAGAPSRASRWLQPAWLRLALAASHRLAAEHGMVALFAAAAERFGVLRCALTHISDTLLFPHHHTPERLMRQVRDESRHRLAG